MQKNKLLVLLFFLADLFLLGGMYYFGLFTYVMLDTSRITLAIIGLYLLGNVLFWMNDSIPENRMVERILIWIYMTLISLGLLGTVVGFLAVFDNLFTGINFADPSTFQKVLEQLGNGYSIAIVSTIAGLTTTILHSLKNLFYAK